MTNIIQFPARRSLNARRKQAALAALAPHLMAIAGHGEFSLTVIGDVKVTGCSVMPGKMIIIVNWAGAKTRSNPEGLVFSANVDQHGIIGKPVHWKRGDWEALVLEPAPQSLTA